MKELFDCVRSLNLKKLFIEPTNNGVMQAFRYVFVGGIAFIVDWGVLFIITAYTHYLIATIIAFVFGLLVNFFLSKAFVFSAEKAIVKRYAEFLMYAMIGAAGLLLTELLMYIGVDVLGIWVMLTKIIVAALVLVWNYALRKVLIYRRNYEESHCHRSRAGGVDSSL